MSRNNTGNPIGSGDPRDREDNSKNLDEAVNKSGSTWTDRFGVTRKTMAGQESEFNAAQSARTMAFSSEQSFRESQFDVAQIDRQLRFNAFIAASGYTGTGAGGAIEDYAAGITITEYNQIIRDSAGEFWRLSGATPLPYTTTGAGLPEGGTLVSVGDAVLRQELAVGDGASKVGYTPAGVGATARTVQAKLRESISVKDFGAVGDGVTDDTAAVHAAIDFAKSNRASVFFPAGIYRVTSGYTQSVAYADVRLYGEGSTRETNVSSIVPSGSHIRLDSTEPNSFFYRQNARHHLQVENLVFSCAQNVLDRKFFRFSSTGANHTFNNLNFESVEKPICYEPGCYFQSSSITNVQFRSSGTIHSELGGGDLRGTLLVLNNVNHEGGVPANSEKIVCNLSGIRHIQGINFLLEGSNPGVDWTILRLYVPYESSWSRAPIAAFHGYWSEWSGTDAQYAVHQTGGRVVFQQPELGIKSSSKYKLDGRGAVEIKNTSFSGNNTAIDQFFELENSLCQVAIYDSNARNFGATKTTPNFTLVNCSEARDGSSLGLIGTNFSNTKSETLWQFDGGNLDSGRIQFNSYGTGPTYPSVDSTYGRKLIITPSGTGGVSVRFQARVFGKTEPGQQWIVALRLKTPVYASGYFRLSWVKNGADAGNASSLASDREYNLILPCSDTDGGSSWLGFSINTLNASEVTGVFEIYYAAIYLGKDCPHTTIPSYPNNVNTFGSAIPTVGEWKRGDVILNSEPSALGTPGWVCVTSGTPGTWSAMANLV